MRGEPSPSTERAVTFVPGTNSTIASVDHYNDALNAMDGHDLQGTHPVITYPLEQDLGRYRQEWIPRVPVDSLTD